MGGDLCGRFTATSGEVTFICPSPIEKSAEEFLSIIDYARFGEGTGKVLCRELESIAFFPPCYKTTMNINILEAALIICGGKNSGRR